jgi:hypothetical protein
MKKIILVQIVFFILLLSFKPIFHTRCDVGAERVFYVQSNIEVMLEILLLLGLSFGMCRYMLKSANMIKTSLLAVVTLCFLFELSKYIEHLLGFFPHYGDVPIIFGIFLSLMITIVYTSILYLICLFLKKIKFFGV